MPHPPYPIDLIATMKLKKNIYIAPHSENFFRLPVPSSTVGPNIVPIFLSPHTLNCLVSLFSATNFHAYSKEVNCRHLYRYNGR